MGSLYTIAMKLTQLRAFVAVVDTSSFSEAGLELGVSQAAISHAIGELEEDLGIKLLERGRFGARPTQASLGIIEYARKIIQNEAAIEQEVALQKGVVTGRLRVAVFRSVAYHLMPPLMKRLEEKYPGLEIVMLEPVNAETQCCSNVHLDMLHRAEVDLTFLYQPTTMMSLENVLSWQILVDPYVVVVPQTFAKPSLTRKDLSEHPLIIADEVTCSNIVQDYLAEHASGVKAKYVIHDDAAMLNMTAQGLGLSLMARLTITHLPPGLRIVELPAPLERTISIGVQAPNFKTPAVRAFLSTLKELYPESGVPYLPIAKQNLTDEHDKSNPVCVREAKFYSSVGGAALANPARHRHCMNSFVCNRLGTWSSKAITSTWRIHHPGNTRWKSRI
jgi:DNA-binding transcriptional LysR family regulator